MDKLLPLLALIVTASISVSRPAMAESRFAAPLSSSFVTDVAGPDAALVLVAGTGGTTGGMGGGATTGGMGGGATTGGMGGGATTGGMGGGATTGGMGGGATTGGMGGGATTGGMGGGATTGGMGGGATTGGMGGGATTGGMGGGATTGGMGGGMFNNPAPSFGTNSSSGWPGSTTQSSYYTYQCVTSMGQCSFVAPASLRASSLRAGARCSCSDGLSQGQIK